MEQQRHEMAVLQATQQKEQLLRANDRERAIEETKEAVEVRHRQVVDSLNIRSEASERALANVIEANHESNNDLVREMGEE